MIKYRNIIEMLAEKGYTTYRIRKEKIIPESTMQKLRANGSITIDTVDTICRLLDCQPGDIMEYVPDIPPIVNLGKITIAEKFNDDFISQNTKYKTFSEFLSAAGVSSDGLDDFDLIKKLISLSNNKKFKLFIKRNSKFKNFSEMLLAAQKIIYQKNVHSINNDDEEAKKTDSEAPDNKNAE